VLRTARACRAHSHGQGAGAATRLRVAVFAAGVTLALLILPGSATAAIGHKFLSRLTDAAGKPLVEPVAVAVDRATGDVFVSDSGALTVDVYDSSGKYLTQFVTGHHHIPASLAVDEASGNVYVVETEASASEGDIVDVFKPAGGKYELLAEWIGTNSAAKRFGEITGIAVDNSKEASAGDVYVLDASNQKVDVFAPPAPTGIESALRGTQLTGGFLEETNGVAVNPENGKVYVLDAALNDYQVFSPSGAFELKVTGKGSPNGAFNSEKSPATLQGIAVDPSGGDIYVSEVRELRGRETGIVEQFTPEGVYAGAVSAGQGGASLEAPRGVAVGPGSKLYLAEAERFVVDEFGPEVVLPDVVTGKATIGKGELSRTTAVLHGTINPLGKDATYRFEYGENEEFTTSIPVPNADAGEGTLPVAEEASLTGLKPGTEYVYRLVGENENGTEFGEVGINKGSPGFTTEDAVEGVVVLPAEAITTESAELKGSLEPNGLDAHYFFEYGTTTEYGLTSPTPPGTDAGVGGKKLAVPASRVIEGLKPNTTYHYRLVASNATFGATASSDETFTTTGAPRIVTVPANTLTHTAATLHSVLNPGGLATKYHYDFGETTGYGKTTTEQELTASFSQKPVEATLPGLGLATTYHYRLVASNSAGTTTGPDQEFTTVLFENVSALSVTNEAAKLSVQINPLGLDTKYHFQYGETTSYGAVTPVPDGDAGTGSANVEETAQLTGLKANTTYHYRVVASVETLGTADSADHTFTTKSGETAPAPLPDGRAYEMVSPVEKHGASIQANPHA